MLLAGCEFAGELDSIRGDLPDVQRFIAYGGTGIQGLRFIAYGASPIAEGTLRRAMSVFGCDFMQAYGMTEATAGISVLMPEEHRRALVDRPGLLLAAGRPLPGTEVRVVDEHDRPLPPGATGEIAMRGPQTMRGYWNRPEATAR